MQNQLIEQNDEAIRIAPESLEVAEAYLQTLDVNQTATSLQLPLEDVLYHLEKREVKTFVDSVFFDKGYMNRHKLQHAIDVIIEKKFEELDEAEMGSSKDIADLLKLAIDFRKTEVGHIQAEEKLKAPLLQQNIQVNSYGENYSNLLNSIIKGDVVK